MSTFDDRKKGFEAKYQQDQEAQFKIRTLRNKLIGQWAANLIKPKDEELYIKEVRVSDLEKPGDDDIIDKLLEDFKLNSVEIDKNEIVKKIEECERIATKQFTENKNNN